ENGVDVPWDTYKRAILQRFRNAFDDPLAELKNIRQVTTIEDYQNAFDKLVSKVDFLEEAYHFSKVQEAAIKANKQRYRTPLLPTAKFITNPNTYTPQSSVVVKQLPVPNTPLATKSAFNTSYPKRQLSQKEFQKRRSKNLCFYYDQKHVGKYKIYILIDSDGTHNFVETTTTKRMGCRISAIVPLQVDVVMGNAQVPAITGLIKEYDDVFVVLTSLPPKRCYDQKIPLRDGALAVNKRPYRHPPTQKYAIENMVKELLDS
nr:gypsy/Ty3 retroelement polyprotein [Tanacetum cinerariifolium]